MATLPVFIGRRTATPLPQGEGCWKIIACVRSRSYRHGRTSAPCPVCPILRFRTVAAGLRPSGWRAPPPSSTATTRLSIIQATCRIKNIFRRFLSRTSSRPRDTRDLSSFSDPRGGGGPWNARRGPGCAGGSGCFPEVNRGFAGPTPATANWRFCAGSRLSAAEGRAVIASAATSAASSPHKPFIPFPRRKNILLDIAP